MNLHEYVFSQPYFGWLFTGVMWTFTITILTSFFSMLIGIPAGMVRDSTNNIARMAAGSLVMIFRNIPLVPFLLFTAFVVPSTFTDVTKQPFPRGFEFMLLIACISLNNAGHIAEIFRSGLRAIPDSQKNAAMVLGLSHWQTRFSILFPQAMNVSASALGMRLIHNMKNSSVAIVIPLSVDRMEVAGQASRIAGQTFAWAEPLLFVAATYLAFSFVMTEIIKFITSGIEKKVSGNEYY